MQDLWYGDKRDRVKWGTLIALAKENSIELIVWIVYYRKFKEKHLYFDNERRDLLGQVWDHFSNPHNIDRLAREASLKIDVYDQDFSSDIDRKTHQKNLLLYLDEQNSQRKIVFLDPDTGIASGRPSRKHISVEEISEVWSKIRQNDLLAIYQHAPHSDGWETRQRALFQNACPNALILTVKGPAIANDVAFFVASRKPKN